MPVQAQKGGRSTAITHSQSWRWDWLAARSGLFTPEKKPVTIVQEAE
jgi:hypothetical protein